MATSGQLNTNTEYDSYFYVFWRQDGDQDIANNRTPIAWECGVYCGHDFYKNAIKMSAFSINGIQVYGGGTYSNFSEGKHAIASSRMWINHGADGKKTFSISSFTGWLYSNHNYSSNGGSFELPTIPRQAEITSAPDFTDLGNPTVYYSNPAGNAVTALDACISLTRTKDDIAYRSISKTGNSYTFYLTGAERDVLRYNTPGPNRTVYFFVRTTIGSTVYHSVQQKTLYIAESDTTRPAVNMDVKLNNGSLPNKFDGLYIQGKSRLDIKLSAEGKYGATIKSYSANIDGKTYTSDSFTTDVITASGKVDVVGYAKDSRGFPGSATEQIYFVPYSKPLVDPIGGENAIHCYRSDGNGVRTGSSTSVWIKAKMTFYSVDGINSCMLQWRKKLVSEEWNDSSHQWTQLITTDNEYNALLSGEVFDKKKSYTVQIIAIDDIGEYDLKTFEIPTEDVALHLGKGGKNVSVGTYCDYSEEHTFYSDWKAIFDKDVVVGGDVLIGENKTTLRDYILNIMNGG